ncbi:MAG: dipeptidase [Anaerolineae bacterium]|nr:dipeptidase [Anaerolineae bacterium]
MVTDRALEAPLSYAAQHQSAHLEELFEFLRIPSISAQPQHREDVARAAEWLADSMTAAGLENVRIIETDGHPLVYGDNLKAGPGAPTVLIYGHYDVQPPEPLDLWESPPFEPDVRDDYVYARGSADDKGQLFIHVKAIEAFVRCRNGLPVNVKVLAEGEEEVGGPSLAAFIPEQEELLSADVAVISDTPMLAIGKPAIVYGLRGLAYMLVDVYGPKRDLHSGHYGGAVKNPINALAHIIARLQDEGGKVLIPGFYDDVRTLDEEERKILSELPFDEQAWAEEIGVLGPWGEPDYTLIERIGARPTLDVNGIVGGYTGEGGKTVLPAHAHAKISMRLVPDQNPEEIADAFTRYVTEIAPPEVRVEVQTTGGGSFASISDYNTDAVRAAADAYYEVYGEKPVLMREGGSIPVVGQLQSHLGLETVLMGFSSPDAQIHAPNERFYLPNYYQGIETVIHFLYGYAQRFRAEHVEES